MKHEDGILLACFSPDGSRVATASEDYTAVVWDANTGVQLSPALKHRDQIFAVAFSPDGKWVATASRDCTARVWNAETGEPLTPPLLHVPRLTSVKFLPDGERLLTGDRRGDSWVWKLGTEAQPPDRLQKLSRLLTSGVIAPAGAASDFQRHSLEPLWNELRTNANSCFSVIPERIAAWHEFAAEQSAARKQWPAVVFHSQQLLLANPGDEFVAGRLAAAERKIAAQSDSKLADAGQPAH